MKLNKIFFALTVAAFASCTADDLITSQETAPISGTDELTDEPMPIRLGVSGGANAFVTRNSIEQVDFDTLHNVGMFMLARYVQDTNPVEGTLTWERTNTTPNSDPMPRMDGCWPTWIDNQKSHIITDGTNRHFIRFWNSDETQDTVCMYPVGQWYSYRFYGYYPYQPSSQVLFDSRRRTVLFDNLDGKTDILWGRSAKANMDDTHEKYAYSARYFRQSGYAENYPSLSFKHKMMALQFQIQGLPDENAPEEEKFKSCNRMFIDTIYVVNVPSHAELIVADLDDLSGSNGDLLATDARGDGGQTEEWRINANDGKISYNWNGSLVNLGVMGWPLADRWLADETTQDPEYAAHIDGAFSKKQVHNDSIMYVGQRLIVPAFDNDAAAYYEHTDRNGNPCYQVRVRLGEINPETGKTIQIYDDERPLDLNLPANPGQGKCYKVLLQIAGPQAINMTATLADWQDVEPDEDAEQGVKPIVFN